MDILQRVTKAARETDEVRHHDHEAIARAVIATLFNWLGDPSDRAIDAGVIGGHHDAATCRTIWTAMLTEMRREAGF
jgi:hypothetical protein